MGIYRREGDNDVRSVGRAHPSIAGAHPTMGGGGKKTCARIYIIVHAFLTTREAQSRPIGKGETSIHRARASVNRVRASVEWGKGAYGRIRVNATARPTNKETQLAAAGRKKDLVSFHTARPSEELACAAFE